MSQVQGLLLIKTSSLEVSERFRFYLDTQTRPDFPDDLPELEEGWLDVFEDMENPDLLEIIDEKYLLVGFFQDEENYSQEMSEFAENLTNELKIDKVIYVEFNADAGQSIWLYTNNNESKLLFDENDGDQYLSADIESKIDKILTDTFDFNDLNVDDTLNYKKSLIRLIEVI